MIFIQLTEGEKKELEDFRKQASSKNSEKSLMILMSNEKKSPVKIATLLKRNPHTIRLWLKRYIESGIEGLQRRYSPGRPRTKRDKIAPIIQELLKLSPLDYGLHFGSFCRIFRTSSSKNSVTSSHNHRKAFVGGGLRV